MISEAVSLFLFFSSLFYYFFFKRISEFIENETNQIIIEKFELTWQVAIHSLA